MVVMSTPHTPQQFSNNICRESEKEKSQYNQTTMESVKCGLFSEKKIATQVCYKPYWLSYLLFGMDFRVYSCSILAVVLCSLT